MRRMRRMWQKLRRRPETTPRPTSARPASARPPPARPPPCHRRPHPPPASAGRRATRAGRPGARAPAPAGGTGPPGRPPPPGTRWPRSWCRWVGGESARTMASRGSEYSGVTGCGASDASACRAARSASSRATTKPGAACKPCRRCDRSPTACGTSQSPALGPTRPASSTTKCGSPAGVAATTSGQGLRPSPAGRAASAMACTQARRAADGGGLAAALRVPARPRANPAAGDAMAGGGLAGDGLADVSTAADGTADAGRRPGWA